MSAQIYLHPTAACDPLAIAIIELRTQMKAVCSDNRVELVVHGTKVEMPVIVLNARKEFAKC